MKKDKKFYRSEDYRWATDPSNPRRIRGSTLNSLKDFLTTKRDDITQSYGSSDKFFNTEGTFAKEVPGLAKAHLTHDISIVYRVKDGNVYLYGIYNHDTLGIGQPANKRRQQSMATQFKNYKFTE